MKKIFASISIGLIVLIIFFSGILNKSHAASVAIDEKTESSLVEIKKDQLKTIEDYQEKYGSAAYGTTAYILHLVQIWSIPICFLGITIGVICDFVIGLKHLEVKEKGLALIVTFITLTVICQVLPLVFAIVVKFGRE